MLLKRGDNGNAVKLLQERLGVPVDGAFGVQTEAAVLTFQKEHNLTADGIVGDLTWTALAEQANAKSKTLRPHLGLKWVAMAPAFPGTNYGKRSTPPSMIVVHHSETASAKDTHRILTGRGLSTHYEVERDGTVREYLNPALAVAWHCGGGVNSRSIGIDVTHYGKQDFPDAQVMALKGLIEILCDTYGIPQVVAPDQYLGRDEHNRARTLPGVGIYRHRNLASTVCPAGLNLEAVNA